MRWKHFLINLANWYPSKKFSLKNVSLFKKTKQNLPQEGLLFIQFIKLSFILNCPTERKFFIWTKFYIFILKIRYTNSGRLVSTPGFLKLFKSWHSLILSNNPMTQWHCPPLSTLPHSVSLCVYQSLSRWTSPIILNHTKATITLRIQHIKYGCQNW